MTCYIMVTDHGHKSNHGHISWSHIMITHHGYVMIASHEGFLLLWYESMLVDPWYLELEMQLLSQSVIYLP